MLFSPYSYAASNPFRDLERLFGGLQTSFNRGAPRFAPRSGEVPLNLWSNEHGLVVTAEVPGVDPASIGVNVVGDTVTITGKRLIGEASAGSDQDAGEDAQERSARAQQEVSFTRTVHLPYRVDAERTEARCREGVLSIALHRPEAERPRTISVKAA